MKIINSVLISAILLLFFIEPESTLADTGSKPDTGSQNKQAILHPKGLLWKIEKPGEANNYLYGTIHVGDPRVTNLPKEVEKAFVQADHFVMEMLLNFKSMGYVASASFFNDGNSLRKLMKDEKYASLSALISERNGISENVLRNMKPWAVLMMLMVPVDQQLQASAALDMVLYRRASLRGIKVTGLETAEEQIGVFESMSLQDQIWMLNRSVEDIDSTDQQMSELLSAYLQRDLEKLIRMQDDFMYEDTDIDDRFMVQLLDVRNVRMAERLRPILKQGNAFIAIGALHLPGEKGVLHLLEKQGYTVSVVY